VSPCQEKGTWEIFSRGHRSTSKKDTHATPMKERMRTVQSL